MNLIRRSRSFKIAAFRLGWFRLLPCLLAATGLARSADEIQLSPLFSDNMVLQEGARNVIWGKAIWDKDAPRKQYVSVAYQNAVYWSERVRSSEDWWVEIKLPDEADLGPGPLVISVGPKKNEQRVAVILTNVAIGDIYLLDPVGDGVPAPRPQTPSERTDLVRKLESVRLASVTSINSAATAYRGAAWRVCSPDTPAFEELSALSFYWTIHLRGLHPMKNSFIGIIQTPTTKRASGLGNPTWQRSLTANRKDHLQELNSIRDPAHAQAVNQVARAQRARKQKLIEAKHAGIVIAPPPLVQYGFPGVYLREAFDLDNPTNFRNFDAAIW